MNPLTQIDFYKADHRSQYPKGTTEVYSNFTARSNKHAKFWHYNHEEKVVFFGLQYFIKHFLLGVWQKEFFDQKKEVVVAQYKKRMDWSLGEDAIDCSHIEALHDLGYLPIQIKALPEGARVNIGVPMITIKNTHPDFFWLTNYLETIISCYLWKPCTTATTAFEFKRMLTYYASKTGTDKEIVNFQAHDFSFRGLSGPMDAALSGAAHLTCFKGTDTVSAIDLVEKYYCAQGQQDIGFSVPATEHSVMSMGGQDDEEETFHRLITEIYPKGLVSIVSDTWDFWNVINHTLPRLKDEILKRDGKVVIRPDSGDPYKILCGDFSIDDSKASHYGAIKLLLNHFGWKKKPSHEHTHLDPRVGLIYGDSIGLENAEQILRWCDSEKIGTGCIVFGVGSYTYQYVTRDNHGFAMKATSGVVNGTRRSIYKDPKTDSGLKKSARGLLRVVEDEQGNYVLHDCQTEEEEEQGCLRPVFKDGDLYIEHTFQEIRDRLAI